jgi:hypothetical protein
VSGPTQNRTRTTTANAVYFRDDWDKKLSGVAVIEKVIVAGAEPEIQADGYRIHVTASTETVYSGDLKTMADVGTNIWLRYEGKRDKAGALVATRVEFLPAKPAKIKGVAGLEEVRWQVKPANANSSSANAGIPDSSLNEGAPLAQDEKIKMGPFNRWHTVPANQPLQERVQRVGNRVVPEYQKNLPENHPSKMHIRFYAVDEATIRSEICSFDGLVLVPSQMVERLKNDDQLAAVLADGVAFNLQRQAAREIADNRLLLGTEVAADVAGFFIPGVSLISLAGGDAASRINIEMQEERGRIALALLADAGYDPWQAPEAWRLVEPKHLPADLNSLKYPSRSGYQLGILNLQYTAKTAGEITASTIPVASEAK